ncbi:hypothetical protein X805_27040 [Sphaerotilus natans subsp. natans DSM 6575]|uniref:Type I restriction modification DNA specificity domain-containing protein n=1 Tax=Sphaerotilus natans subsp. natans DSM 6575 TaxID=1286631 RepID=A0A059KJN6_9BURK|nr:restriction endonuclease subunit S [Sphaerotilus natans]KDB51677.1 hypothetical protein X805_27040 [Sphaerotilus natans subsp. natans DSM 6575]
MTMSQQANDTSRNPGWTSTALSQLSSVVRGASPRPAGDPKYFNGDFIPWLTVAALTNIPESKTIVFETAGKLTEAGAQFSRTLTPGTVIIANSGATLGVAKILGIRCCANDGIAALLDLCSDVDARYIVYQINSQTDRLRTVVATGNGQPNLNTGLIGAIEIDLPCKDEQSAIADALTDADALIDSLEQLLAKKRQIKQGAMQELLTGKRRLPGFDGAWSFEELRNLVQTPVTDGPHTTPVFVDSGVPFLSVNNLVGNRIDLTDLRFITREDDQIFAKKCKPQRGDVLLGKAASVGKVAIVEEDFDFNIWSPIALIRAGSSVVSKFLYYQLQSRSVLTQIAVLTNSSSQGNIGMGDIEKLQITVPCVDEQSAIAQVLSDMDADIAAVDDRLTKARAMKQAMAQVLLTGRVRLV